MKLLDALLNRPVAQTPSSQYSPAEIARPVPVAFIVEPPSDLTSGSAINQAAVGPWPQEIDAGAKYWNGGWRKSVLREIAVVKEPGNYGSITGGALFGARWRAFVGVGDYPGPVPNPYRPTFNDLTAISWGLRVPNPNTKVNTTAQKGPITIQTTPSTWEGSNTASLRRKNETLL